MKLTLLSIASIIAISCSSSPKLTDVDLTSKIGWMHGNCLAIKNPNIPSRFSFDLVHLGEEQITEKAVIIQKAFDGEKCYPLLDDRVDVNAGAGYTFYLVESKKTVNLAIGVLASEDIRSLDFSFCTTTEGIQFIISDKDSSVIWKGYYYLGYESEATCTEY